MSKKNFSCDELNISHADLIKLREAGHLNLGIDNSVALQISNTPGLGPTKTTSSAAFHFWSWIAVAVFGFSIYWSFTHDWWWFIPGFFVMLIIWRANKSGNAENVLEAAFHDRDFYERVQKLGGWIYQIDEAEADAYRVQS